MDANGVYTIAGNIENTHALPVQITLTIHVRDKSGNASFTHAIHVPYNPIPAGGELPFQVKAPGASQNAEIERYEIDVLESYTALHRGMSLDVIYDNTLVTHENGSLTGFAINSGDTAIHDPVILAVAHGTDGSLLDVSRSMPLGIIPPGHTVPFEMHADPSLSDRVAYYSCFVPSENWIHPLTAKRIYDNGDVQEYKLRYESGAWLYRPVFENNGSSITIQTTNSYPFETYANIEVPPVTGEEEFDVYRNDEPINHTQSVDEMGMWHLAFDIRGHSQDVITISGFEHGDTLRATIPDYVRHDMARWASGETVGDKALIDALLLLADHELLPPIDLNLQMPVTLPGWLATIIVWWDTRQIDDDQIMGTISHMIKTGIIGQDSTP